MSDTITGKKNLTYDGTDFPLRPPRVIIADKKMWREGISYEPTLGVYGFTTNFLPGRDCWMYYPKDGPAFTGGLCLVQNIEGYVNCFYLLKQL